MGRARLQIEERKDAFSAAGLEIGLYIYDLGVVVGLSRTMYSPLRRPFVSVEGKIHFASTTATEAQKSDFCYRKTTHFVEVGGANSAGDFDLLPISVIYNFCDVVSTAHKVDCDAVIICPEDGDCQSICNACLLLGSYLILRVEMKSEKVLQIFEETINELSQFQSQIKNYVEVISKSWNALEYAKGLNWLFPSEYSEIEADFDIELHTHYARQANGNIHTLVPGKLLLFPTPAHLPGGQSWADVDGPGGQVRRFSAQYLAELLADLNVSVVTCLGQTSSSSAAAFLECGLDVHDLLLNPRLPSLLSAIDRILALTRAAPGAVAVFCGGAGGTDWPAHVGTLAAAYLMSDFGFDAGAADAWLRMLSPLIGARSDRLQ
jgi:hypothetical protein